MEKENTGKSEVALREEKILEFWRVNQTFKKSLEKKSPKGHYVFYDGPPFATGQIHYGHILGSTVKDVIGRYKTMQGFYVPRKWGWDCHGLPIENIVEKELGVAGHKEIEKLGIDKFVEHARSLVFKFDKDWEKGIERIGRWVDFKGSYKTMDNTFIESVWWALSELNKKDLIYEGVRVLAYCARCETPIANSEIAMDNSYKDIADISIYVKFKLKPGQNYGQGKETKDSAYLVAWTTTPWTLPGNTAIAVGENINYTALRVKGVPELMIVATECVKNVFKDKEIEVVHDDIKGVDLVGLSYEPVFPYYKDVSMPNKENIWKVWHADFVTTEKGTGIAHEAPAFGEEDSVLAKANNIPMIVHVDTQGRFVDAVADFKGLKVKPKDTAEDKDAHLRTDIEIIKYLQNTGAYFNKEKIIHSYPHCMRCDTPIIYYALPSWFINITKEKSNIIKQADKINWIPSHLKEGRFKNIVENAPDWNISRNRYWASPLPIWKCDKCKEKTFVSSLEDLKNKTKKSGNKYFVMRHGEADNNTLNVLSSNIKTEHHVNAKGIEEVKKSAQKLKGIKFDHVFASPLMRTQETLKIVQKELGLTVPVENEDRLWEVRTGEFDGKGVPEYLTWLGDRISEFTKVPKGGECLNGVRKRVGEFLYELESKYKNKNILIFSHGDPIWMMHAVAGGMSSEQALDFNKRSYPKNAEIYEMDLTPLPHNELYELDLHRPYIDEVKLSCDCGGDLKRITEVLDCWFESGSMPFAQDHYPFENKQWQKNNFPAGFIAEYIAQTRTWFYYTHAVSTMLFGKIAFKNVVTTGTLRAEDGEKMSKSKSNYPDPWVFIDKYGVDALRIYLMASPLMKGEDANFSEKAVQDIASKIIGRLFNVFAFYELYRDKGIENNDVPKSKNILDQWIVSRFYQTLSDTTIGMENYDMTEATRPMDSLVDDLSTWYLRRSRERIKDGDKEAKKTLYFILKTLAITLAPFAPFTAEDMWLKLRNEDDVESVHLASWPVKQKKWFSFGKSTILEDMEKVREAASVLLKKRQEQNIPVRQMILSATGPSFKADYVEILKQELNTKNYVGSGDFSINIEITKELKEEGDYRELVRALQDMRKKLGLTPSDVINISFATDERGKNLIKKFEKDMKKTVLVSKIEFGDNDGEEVRIYDVVFKVKISK